MVAPMPESHPQYPLAGYTCTNKGHSFDGTVRDEFGKCPKCEAEMAAGPPGGDDWVYTEEKVAQPFKCPACGQKKRKPRTEQTKDATPKERSRVRIDIPVGERAHGYDDFMDALGRVRSLLGPALGYDQDTPNWYVMVAVLTDWLNSNDQRQAAT
jgi:predicted Zn-ribbon and HTH transcriptional regulator